MIFSSRIVNSFVLSIFAVILMALIPQQEWDEFKTSTAPEDTLLKDVTAEEFQNVVDTYKGEKAVLINIWATWCAPCIEEFPHIVKLQREYEDELRVIFVSADFPESRDKAVEFLNDQNVDWTTYFKRGKDQPFIEAVSENWSGALPFTKILNQDGEVVASWEQGADYEKFERNIKKAINN